MKSMKEQVAERLSKYTTVSVIGAGGIGSWLLSQLCYWLAAHGFKGHVQIWDGDHYETKNLDRQNFPVDALKINKAQAKAEELSAGFTTFAFQAYDEYVGPDNIDLLSIENSIVFSCVDNHPLRALLAKSLAKIKNTIVFSCGNELFDGNVHVTVIKDGKTLTEPLLDRHPYIATATAGDRSKLGCADLIEEGQTQLLAVNASIAQMAILALDHTMRHGTVQHEKGTSPYVFENLVNDMYFDAVQLKVVPVWSGVEGAKADGKKLLEAHAAVIAAEADKVTKVVGELETKKAKKTK